MSTQYDMAIAFDLKPDVSQAVLDTLKYMTRTEDYKFESVLEEFSEGYDYSLGLEENDWRWVLRNVYKHMPWFPGAAGSSLQKVQRSSRIHRYSLSFRLELPDDAFAHLYQPLLKWLASYAETEGCVGYYRYEYNLHPTLIYFKDGKVYYLKVEGTPREERTGHPLPPIDDMSDATLAEDGF